MTHSVIYGFRSMTLFKSTRTQAIVTAVLALAVIGAAALLRVVGESRTVSAPVSESPSELHSAKRPGTVVWSNPSVKVARTL